MDKKLIIELTLNNLKSSFFEKEEIFIGLHEFSMDNIFYPDSDKFLPIAGIFSGIDADAWDDGLYYDPSQNIYFYFGTPEVFNNSKNVVCFLLDKQLLALLPAELKAILKRVGVTGKAEVFHYKPGDTFLGLPA
jgi:hypothetical protein